MTTNRPLALPEGAPLEKRRGFVLLLRLLRMPHWIKNILLFVPLVTAHQFTKCASWRALLLMFFSFSFCASAVYIINDLLDRANDRLHPRKRHRPFASGALAPWVGCFSAPLLLALSGGIAFLVSMQALGCVALYFFLTSCYSLFWKHQVLWDCLVLAMLYTLRIITGVVTLQMELSFWLLTCSVFLFLSLAFVKRYAELRALSSSSSSVAGRGYLASDSTVVHTMGITSGYVSVLVLALYLHSDAVHLLYQTPQWLWGMVPTLLFWISWMWLHASRGEMQDDPVVFAMRDPTSLLAGAACVGFMCLGMVRGPWASGNTG